MDDNVVDFEIRKEGHLFKRKEAKVDALRRAFRQARGETEPSSPRGGRKRRPKSSKK